MNTDNDMLIELQQKCEEQEKQIDSLKEELLLKEKIINEFPQLSSTSVGQDTTDGKVKVHNWFKISSYAQFGVGSDAEFCDNLWFPKFINCRFPNEDYKIHLYGVYGEHDESIMKNIGGKKIFYTPEDLSQRFTHLKRKFGYYALDYVDLSLGFDLIEQDNYLRFPYWLTRNFLPTSDEEEIENKIEWLNSRSFEKTKNVAQISRHDWGHTRSKISEDVEKFTKIDYAGKWRNNTSELWDTYNDVKALFLEPYKFNICAENLNANGYVTEKIFEAIRSDCIPLYIGGGNYLEPQVLNKNAILLWDCNDDNSDTIELFESLLLDEKSYNDFKEQNPLLDTSSKYVIETFNKLEKHIERLITE